MRNVKPHLESTFSERSTGEPMTRRLLVTGGAGFIGSHVAEQALHQGWQVAVIDDLSGGDIENVPANATFYQVDVRNSDEVERVFRAFMPTVVSHHAAQVSVSTSVCNPLLDAEVNVIGTLNLLEASRESWVKRFVFASTGGAIYGEVPDVSATEKSHERPISPYAISKLTAERYIAYYREMHGLESRILRYANVYGPRQSPHGEAGVVAIFLKRILSGESISINAQDSAGDDGCIRDYLYVGDAAKANLAAFEKDIPVLMNVATGVPTSTRQLATRLAELSEKPLRLDFNDRRVGDIKRSVLSPELYSTAVGVPITLQEGLAETVRWFTQRIASQP